MTAEENSKEIQKVTITGSFVDAIVGTTKIVVGSLFHSHALVVDGLHSFSDLATDIFVVAVARYSHEAPDKEHPYGHGRIETIGTIVMGSMLFAAAGALAYDNIMRIINNTAQEIPTWPTLVAALFSILAKEGIYHYIVNVGKRLKSNMLIASAWHSRSDAISSVVVFIGILCTMYGLPYVDNIAAVIVAVMIGKIGFDFILDSLKELADEALDPETLRSINRRIKSIEGVRGTHNLRSRRVGQKAILDVNVEVVPNLTASEAHEISSWVAKIIMKEFDEVIDITVHTDVEDDMEKPFISHKDGLLPLRSEVLKALHAHWGELLILKSLIKIDLHYLEGKIEAHLYLPISLQEDRELSLLTKPATELKWFKGTKIWFG